MTGFTATEHGAAPMQSCRLARAVQHFPHSELCVEFAVGLSYSYLSEERVLGGIERGPVSERLKGSLDDPDHAVDSHSANRKQEYFSI